MVTLMGTAVDVGTTKRLEIAFSTLSDDPVPLDPASVTLTLIDPDGVWLGPAVQQAASGDYYAEFTVPVSGQWRFRWEGVNPARAVEGSFFVRSSLLQPANPGTLTAIRNRYYAVVITGYSYDGTLIDFDGYTVTMAQVRTSSDELVATFATSFPVPNGGDLLATLTADQLNIDPATYQYEIVLAQPDGNIISFKQGDFIVVNEIAK